MTEDDIAPLLLNMGKATKELLNTLEKTNFREWDEVFQLALKNPFPEGMSERMRISIKAQAAVAHEAAKFHREVKRIENEFDTPDIREMIRKGKE